MPRPRRPYSGQEHLQWGGQRWADLTLGSRQRARWVTSQTWSYRVPNGLYDPLSYLLVLDAVAGIDISVELRSHRLTEFLNTNFRQFQWDPVTVGKIVADLCFAFERALGVKNGILEQSRDHRGYFYLIRRGGAVSDLYIRVREELMAQASLEMTQRARGDKVFRPASPLLECASLLGEWEDA